MLLRPARKTVGVGWVDEQPTNPRFVDLNLMSSRIHTSVAPEQGGETGDSEIAIEVEVLSSISVKLTFTPNEYTTEYFYGVLPKDQYEQYGEEFCALIKRHCEENEIDRPEDIRIRTVANKSKLKVAIITAIDRKVALDDLAISKGVEFDELLDDIESIVYSGTKLNIDYFLEEILDEENMLEIYDYFKNSDTDNINTAIEELGGEYSEEEIRLVRVKFISEMGN